jgi:hypothetical protein
MLQARIAEAEIQDRRRGLREAAIRGLLYVGSVRGMVDERSLAALRQVRRNDNANDRRTALARIRQGLSASAEISGEVAKRLKRVADPFGVDAPEVPESVSNVAPFDPKAKTS